MSEINADDLDPEKIKNEIYDSILKEVVDEVNVPRQSLSDPLLFGVCRNTTSAGRPSAEFLIRYETFLEISQDWHIDRGVIIL